MKEDGRDEYDIMKMGLVVQESLGMIPHCHRRLVAAHNDLLTFVENMSDVINDEEDETAEQVQYKAALEQLSHAKEIISTDEENGDLNQC